MCRSRLVLASDVGAVGNTVVVVGVPIVGDQLKPNQVAGITATRPRVSFDPISVRGLGPDGSLNVPGLASASHSDCVTARRHDSITAVTSAGGGGIPI